MHLVRMGQRAGTDRIQARLQRLEQVEPSGQWQVLREFPQHVSQLPAPEPVLQLGLVLWQQQTAQRKGLLTENLQLLRGDPGNFQVLLQRNGQRQARQALEFNLGLAIELHQGEQLCDQRRAVARPDAQGVACLVAEAAARKIEHQLAGFLAGTWAVEYAVLQQGRGVGLLLAVRRSASGFAHRRRRRVAAQLGQQRLQPTGEGCIVVRLAIDPLQQAPPAQLGEPLIELATETAELVIAGIAQGQHGVGQIGAMGALLALQRLPERCGAVGCVAIAKGAGDQHDAGCALQLLRADRFHAAQVNVKTGTAQVFGTALGQGFAVAGLRGPQHLMARRGGRHARGSLRLREQTCQQAIDEQPSAGSQRRTCRQAWHTFGAGLVQAQQKTVQVMSLILGQHRGGQVVQAEQTGQGGGRHAGRLREVSGGAKIEGVDSLAGNPFQGHGAVLEGRLQRQRIDGIAGHRVDRQLLADHIVPVERRETVAWHHPVSDARGQQRLATARANGHLVFVADAQACGVLGVQFDEGARLQAVQCGHLAGLGQGVPLVLHAAGIEHHGKRIVGQFRGRQPGPGEEPRLAAGGRKGQCGTFTRRVVQQVLAAAIVVVAQRAAGVFTAGRAGPLVRLLAQFGIADAAQIVACGRVPETPDFFVHGFGIGVVESVGIAHGAGHAGDDLPVRQALAGRFDGARHEGQVALAVDHHALAFCPQRRGQKDIGVAIGFGVEEGVLGDHQFGLAQAVDHLLTVGDTGHRVAADDPAGFHVAGLHLLEQCHGALAPCLAQTARGQVPLGFDERSVSLDQRRTLTRQARPHVAHLPTAHGIGLPGE
ncbi:hypothetical protein D3C79_520930 [compost metagenome]